MAPNPYFSCAFCKACRSVGDTTYPTHLPCSITLHVILFIVVVSQIMFRFFAFLVFTPNTTTLTVSTLTISVAIFFFLFLERFTGTLPTPSLLIIIFVVVHTDIITFLWELSISCVKLAVTAAALPFWQVDFMLRFCYRKHDGLWLVLVPSLMRYIFHTSNDCRIPEGRIRLLRHFHNIDHKYWAIPKVGRLSFSLYTPL